MSDGTLMPTERTDVFNARRYPELYLGLRTRRSIAFVIDCIMITMFMIAAAVFVFVLGIFTLGLGWFLFMALWPLVAILYYAFAFAGPGSSATPGMRAMGIEMRMWYGEPVEPLIAVAHAVLFYVSVSFLTPLVLLATLFDDRKRLLHDLVLGTVVIDRAAAHQLRHEVLASA